MEPSNDTGIKSRNGLWLLLPVAILLMIFWQWVSSPMIVTVTGSGTATVPATGAFLSFNILSSDTSAQGAISTVSGKASVIKSLLVSRGIAETDIVQTQVTAAPITSGAGFQALIQMGAKTVHISDISSLVTDLYNNGVSSVSQPVFSVDNQRDLQATAFNDAMKDANSQAAKIASKNWKLFRKVINVSQTSSGTTSTTTSKPDTLMEANNQQAATNGVFKIVQSVSVSYKMW